MIELTDLKSGFLAEGEKKYSHLENSVEELNHGLVKIKESVVKEYCDRCKNKTNCFERVKKYNNVIYAEMWRLNKEAKELEAKRFAEKLARELPLRKAESIKKLNSVVKVDVPDTVVKVREVDEVRKEYENDMIKEKERTGATMKFIGHVIDRKLYTDEAEKLYSVVKTDSIVKPRHVRIENFTNDREAERLIREKLERGEKIPTLVVKEKDEAKDAQREAIRNTIKKVISKNVSVDQHRARLEQKINMMEVKKEMK